MVRASLIAIAALAACDRTACPITAPASTSIAVDAQPAETIAPPDAGAAPAIANTPAADASPPTPSKPVGKCLGAKCSGSGECAQGLACCDTGFTGHCGGANMPDQMLNDHMKPQQPCIVTRSCARGPCAPISFPP